MAVLLLVAAVAGIAWANSPWSAGYDAFWTTELTLGPVSEDLRHWVADGLMAVFFFVVSLEVKHDVRSGRLSAGLPIAAAVGGMVVPALLYVAVNAGGDGAAGWGIPMATDIAFAVGVVGLLGARVPAALTAVLLALAIVDDIGAIVVIAVFYSGALELGWLSAAVGCVAGVATLRRLRVGFVPLYVVLAAAAWVCTQRSGVHATIAGVAIGLLLPERPALQERLRWWSSAVILPVFAVAASGVELSSSVLSDAAGSAVTIGVTVGLVVGKCVGVLLGVAVAVRLGMARIPPELTRRHLVGLAAIAGVGFSVSLFIAGLAFDDPVLRDEATIGVLVGSAVAAVAGVLVLRGAPAATVETLGRERAQP